MQIPLAPGRRTLDPEYTKIILLGSFIQVCLLSYNYISPNGGCGGRGAPIYFFMMFLLVGCHDVHLPFLLVVYTQQCCADLTKPTPDKMFLLLTPTLDVHDGDLLVVHGEDQALELPLVHFKESLA